MSFLLDTNILILADGARLFQRSNRAPELNCPRRWWSLPPAVEAVIRERLGTNGGDVYAETHRWLDPILLPLVLEHTGGVQRQAASLLGIARQTLRQRLRELDLASAGMHVGSPGT